MIRKRYYVLDKQSDTKKSRLWLPDLTSIKVKKIFLEVDTGYYDANDPWYSQFDEVYVRNKWPYRGKYCWKDHPLLKWSVSEHHFNGRINKEERVREGIKFIASFKRMYTERRSIKALYETIICDTVTTPFNYWSELYSAQALLCPREHRHGGNFVPAKIFEYSVSGAAIITNCHLIDYGMEDLNEVVLRYEHRDDIKQFLDMDFTAHYGKAREVMRNHTHKIRYKEMFGD